MVKKCSNENSIVFKALRKIASIQGEVEVDTFIYFPDNEDEHQVKVKWWPVEGGEGDFEILDISGGPLDPAIDARLQSNPEALRMLKERVKDEAARKYQENLERVPSPEPEDKFPWNR